MSFGGVDARKIRELDEEFVRGARDMIMVSTKERSHKGYTRGRLSIQSQMRTLSR